MYIQPFVHLGPFTHPTAYFIKLFRRSEIAIALSFNNVPLSTEGVSQLLPANSLIGQSIFMTRQVGIAALLDDIDRPIMNVP